MSRYTAQPQVSHLKAAKHSLCYIKGTWDFGTLYTRESNLDSEGFVDSDWVGEIESRNSTTGYVFGLAGGLVTWQSKKQPTIALSLPEAEYCSLSDSTREASWLAILTEDFGLPRTLPTVIQCDNDGNLRMALSDGIKTRTRHIATHYHFFREKIEAGEISPQDISSVEQVADILAKPLGRHLFGELRARLQIMGTKQASGVTIEEV